MTLPIAATCFVSFGILLVFIGLAAVLRPANPLDSVLRQYAAQPRTLEEMDQARPFGERVISPVLQGIASVMTRFTPKRSVSGIGHLLDVAGNPFNMTALDFIGLRGLSMLMVTGMVVLSLSRATMPALQQVVMLLFGIWIGFYLPMYWLRMKARARQDNITKALPDALDLLTISLEAGLGLDASIQRVTQKWDNELSQAFARVLTEIRVGRIRREALRDMADKTDVTDLSNFIASLIQAEEMGSSITSFMHIQSEEMRVVRRQRAQEKAQQAPIKMLIPLLLFIFPAMFIVILGPAVLQFMNSLLFKR